MQSHEVSGQQRVSPAPVPLWLVPGLPGGPSPLGREGLPSPVLLLPPRISSRNVDYVQVALHPNALGTICCHSRRPALHRWEGDRSKHVPREIRVRQKQLCSEITQLWSYLREGLEGKTISLNKLILNCPRASGNMRPADAG